MSLPSISRETVQQHCSAESCWVIIHDKVYDVTTFLDKHPGGRRVLLTAAGTDATKAFDSFHKPSILMSAQALCVGVVAMDGGAAARDKTTKMGDMIQRGAQSHAHVSVERDSFGDMIPFGDPAWYVCWTSRCTPTVRDQPAHILVGCVMRCRP